MEAEPPQAEPPERKRRWYQFRLRTLFVAVTLLAVPMGYVGGQVKVVRERKAWLSTIRDRGGNVVTVQMVGLYFKPREPISSFREWLGDIAIQGMQLPTDTKADDVDRIKIAFPESDITLRPNDP